MVDQQVSHTLEGGLSRFRAEVHGLLCSARLLISVLHSWQVQAFLCELKTGLLRGLRSTPGRKTVIGGMPGTLQCCATTAA